MKAHLPALQKVELADLGAVLAGRFCLGESGDRLRVVGGDFLPRRREDTKKGRFFTTKARSHDESGFLSRSEGRSLANLGALCGFVVQTLPLMAGRGWFKGGLFLPRSHKDTKKGEGLRGGAGQSAIRNLQSAIRNGLCLARGSRSSRRGGCLPENGDALREKGRCFSLHALHALHGGKLLRQKGGRLLRRGETMKDMKSMKSINDSGFCSNEVAERASLSSASLRLSSASFRLSSASLRLSSASFRLSSASFRLLSASFRLSSASFRLLSASFRLLSASFRLLSASFRLLSASASVFCFRVKSPRFCSKRSVFDEKHPFFSENSTFFHADTLPAVTRCFRPVTSHQSPVTHFPPLTTNQQQPN